MENSKLVLVHHQAYTYAKGYDLLNPGGQIDDLLSIVFKYQHLNKKCNIDNITTDDFTDYIDFDKQYTRVGIQFEFDVPSINTETVKLWCFQCLENLFHTKYDSERLFHMNTDYFITRISKDFCFCDYKTLYIRNMYKKFKKHYGLKAFESVKTSDATLLFSRKGSINRWKDRWLFDRTTKPQKIDGNCVDYICKNEQPFSLLELSHIAANKNIFFWKNRDKVHTLEFPSILKKYLSTSLLPEGTYNPNLI